VGLRLRLHRRPGRLRVGRQDVAGAVHAHRGRHDRRGHAGRADRGRRADLVRARRRRRPDHAGRRRRKTLSTAARTRRPSRRGATTETVERIAGHVLEGKGTDSAGGRIFRVRIIEAGDSQERPPVPGGGARVGGRRCTRARRRTTTTAPSRNCAARRSPGWSATTATSRRPLWASTGTCACCPARAHGRGAGRDGRRAGSGPAAAGRHLPRRDDGPEADRRAAAACRRPPPSPKSTPPTWSPTPPPEVRPPASCGRYRA
jgi:hypothetical protein